MFIGVHGVCVCMCVCVCVRVCRVSIRESVSCRLQGCLVVAAVGAVAVVAAEPMMGFETEAATKAASRRMAATMAPLHLTLPDPAQDRVLDLALYASAAAVVAAADRVGT